MGALPDSPNRVHLRAYKQKGQLGWGGPGLPLPLGGASPRLWKPDGHPVLWVSEVSKETMEEVITGNTRKEHPLRAQHQVRFLMCAVQLNPSRRFNMPISQVDRDGGKGC